MKKNKLIQEDSNIPNILESNFSEALSDENPYPGLNSYDEAQESIFFGRQKEKEDILKILDVYSLCLLIGKSGIGKTSLIHAGLIPALKKTSFVPINIRINFDLKEKALSLQVKETIESKLKEVDVNIISFNGKLLWEYFQEVKIFGGYLRPVLIFDQFEEIFSRGAERKDELNDLLSEIIDLAENRIPEKVQKDYVKNNKTIPSGFAKEYRIIFSMREDYLPQLTGFRKYIPTLRYTIYRIEQMQAQAAFEAIYFPAEKATLMKKETAWLIVNEIPESKDDEFEFSDINNDSVNTNNQVSRLNKRIEPFLLNLFCFTLNEERKVKKDIEARRIITDKDVTSKSFTSIIQKYYEQIVKKKYSYDLAIGKELITPDGKYRKFSQKNNFEKAGQFFFRFGQLEEPDIEYLINNKVIRRKRINDLDYFELIHDVLVPVVVEKRHKRRSKRILGYACLTLLVLFASFYSLIKLQQDSIKEQYFADLKNQQDSIQRAYNLRSQKDSIQRAYSLRNQQDSIQRAYSLRNQQDSIERAYTLKNQQDSIRRAYTLKSQQDSILRAYDLKKQEDEIKQQQALNSAKESIYKNNQIYTDSIRRVYTSLRLAQNSLNESNIFLKRTFAMLAYDTLPSSIKQKIDDVFPSDLYQALVGSLISRFKDTTYNKEFKSYYGEMASNKKHFVTRISISNIFRKIDAVYNIKDKYYFTITLNSLQRNDGFFIKDSSILHSWINKSDSYLAKVLLNPDRTKKLVIQDLRTNNISDIVNLTLNEDIISLLFSPDERFCIYSTRTTNNEGSLFKLQFNSNSKAEKLMSLSKNEFLFLDYRETNQFVGVSNFGKYYTWKNFSGIESPFLLVLPNDGVPVTTISYNPPAGKLFIGYENGEIRYVNKLNQNSSFYLPSNNQRVTALTCSPDGKFLSAGYFKGSLILWNLHSSSTIPIYILDNKVNTSEISSICFFANGGQLIAVTFDGIVYTLPLSINFLVTELKQKFTQKITK